MRRKTPSQGGSSSGGYNNNQARKPRYQGGGGDYRSQGQNNNSHSGNRPRKNYTAMREKYLAQARDALASGDRVLAENYFQHADHCYRMMVEEGYNTRNNYTPPPQNAEGTGQNEEGGQQHQQDGQQEGGQDSQNGNHGHDDNGDDHTQENTNQLPAFLTANFEHPDQPKQPEPVIVQNWEE